MTKYTKIDVPVAQARMKDCFQFYVRNIIIQSWCHRTCYVHKFISAVVDLLFVVVLASR